MYIKITIEADGEDFTGKHYIRPEDYHRDYITDDIKVFLTKKGYQVESIKVESEN